MAQDVPSTKGTDRVAWWSHNGHVSSTTKPVCLVVVVAAAAAVVLVVVELM